MVYYWGGESARGENCGQWKDEVGFEKHSFLEE